MILYHAIKAIIEGRDPKWPKVRVNFLLKQPYCRACGGIKYLQVHHKKPFHKFPTLELVESNLITLCESPGHNCHYVFGHNLHWSGWNDHVEEDVVIFIQRVNESLRNAA